MIDKAFHVRRAVIAALLAAPLLSCFWLVAAYGTNLPYQDDWAFMFEAGSLLLGDSSILNLLNHQHNDHRMGVPYLFLLCIGLCTGWNWVSMMQANVVILSLTNILVLAWAWSRLKTHSLPLLILLPISLVMCSFRQWENLLFAFQSCVYLCNLFFLLSLISIERSMGVDWKFSVSIFCASCAVYSNGNGLLTLPLGLLALILQWLMAPPYDDQDSPSVERALTKKKIWIWLAFSPAIVILFFHSYLPQGFFRFKIDYWSEDPIGTLKFLLGTFGTLFANDIENAVRWGAFFLLTTLLTMISFYVRRSADRFSITAIIIVLFGLSFDLLVFLGRAGFALDHSISKGDSESFMNALCSRYATTNSLTLVALYVLVIWSYRRGWLSMISTAFVSILIGCCLYVSITIGIPTAEVWHDLRLTEKSILENRELVSETSMKRIYPFVDCMDRFNANMESLGFFRRKNERFPSYLPCKKEVTGVISYVNGAATGDKRWLLSRDTDILVKGWAFDMKSGKPATAVWIFIDKEPHIRAAYGLNRPELSNFRDRLRFGHTGFAAVFSAKQIASGRHELSLKVISSDARKCIDSGPAAIIEIP